MRMENADINYHFSVNEISDKILGLQRSADLLASCPNDQ